jgi:hypothetical protein
MSAALLIIQNCNIFIQDAMLKMLNSDGGKIRRCKIDCINFNGTKNSNSAKFRLCLKSNVEKSAMLQNSDSTKF